jgi:molecular chaperone HtpG
VARASPYIEKLRELAVEVLLLSDRVDEWTMAHLERFDGRAFKDAARGELELGGLELQSDRDRRDHEQRQNRTLLKRVKDALGDRVTLVRVAARLRESPACLVLSEQEPGSALRRMLESAGQKLGQSRPVLELNVGHPMVQYLDGLADPQQFAELAELLYDQAALAEGGQLGNPAQYVQRLNRLLVRLAGAQGTAPSPHPSAAAAAQPAGET